jgi:hypothetical protein
MELMKASQQWMSRPDDERYLNLPDMLEKFEDQRDHSRELVVSSRKLEVIPDGVKDILIAGPKGEPYAPSHFAFGQVATLVGAPAGYLRDLPAPIVADNLNYGLKFKRGPEEVGILLQKNGSNLLRAATGPRYGRIWNSDIVAALIKRFGNGVDGDFRVPGIWGKKLSEVTKENTTLYAGDRDMFVFLADEDHRIEIPNRRNGKKGTLARGFFVWNSEVGSATFGLATFLFDYVCGNRIVWGAEGYKEIKIRHTVTAPDRFLEELKPALISYANGSTTSITDAVKEAQNARLGDELDDFLAKRFGARKVATIKAAHELEEGRPIESRWDVVTAATAYAKGIEYQDERVAVEREAGKILG